MTAIGTHLRPVTDVTAMTAIGTHLRPVTDVTGMTTTTKQLPHPAALPALTAPPLFLFLFLFSLRARRAAPP
jgi:hypothetical protein